MDRAQTINVRSPIDARNKTSFRSTTRLLETRASQWKRMSTAPAPSISILPTSAAFVMPFGISWTSSCIGWQSFAFDLLNLDDDPRAVNDLTQTAINPADALVAPDVLRPHHAHI